MLRLTLAFLVAPALAFASPITLSEPIPADLNTPLIGSATWFSGAVGTGRASAGANTLTITGDSAAYQGGTYLSTLHIDHNFGGAGMIGSRAGIDLSMIMTAPSSNKNNANAYYVGIADYISCGQTDNGSNGFATVSGSCVAFNPIANIGTGQGWYTLNTEEIDTDAAPGSYAAHTFGSLYVKSGGGSRGAYDDAAIAVVANDGMSYGTVIQIGKTDGTPGTAADSTLIGCVENVQTNAPCPIGNVLDVRKFQVAGYVIVGNGFSIDGQGNANFHSITVNGQPIGVSAASAPTSGDTLVLYVSEDAWQGDAEYTVSIDGQQIGGTMTASASHGTGQTQAVTITSTLAPGQHTVSVNFLNDAYGGSASTDRNLYVDRATLNGQVVIGGTLILLGNGPQSFTITAP